MRTKLASISKYANGQGIQTYFPQEVSRGVSGGAYAPPMNPIYPQLTMGIGTANAFSNAFTGKPLMPNFNFKDPGISDYAYQKFQDNSYQDFLANNEIQQDVQNRLVDNTANLFSRMRQSPQKFQDRNFLKSLFPIWALNMKDNLAAHINPYLKESLGLDVSVNDLDKLLLDNHGKGTGKSFYHLGKKLYSNELAPNGQWASPEDTSRRALDFRQHLMDNPAYKDWSDQDILDYFQEKYG
jgi:hypothetical protein